MLSPGIIFCLLTMNADCNTVYRQCRFLVAGTTIQSPAICSSALDANIFA